jgi:hypothetical protein
MSEITEFWIYFRTGKTREPGPRVVDHRDSGPPWTSGHCRSQELAGARPPATPVPESSDRGAGEREGRPANPMAGLSRLERRWRGGSPATETSARKDDGEGAVRARRGGVGGVGGFTVGGIGFYRARRGGGGPSAFNCRLEGGSMARLKAPISRIEEGGMALINGGK